MFYCYPVDQLPFYILGNIFLCPILGGNFWLTHERQTEIPMALIVCLSTCCFTILRDAQKKNKEK